jgi:1,4-alpha-glucan branching enzyme
MVTQMRNGFVEFRFYRPQAHQVCLAGEFNGWNLTGLPMAKCPDGWWNCQMRLAPGCYQFRYMSDGQWFLDYAAFGLEHGPFGLNSVVRVEAQAVREACEKAAPQRIRSQPATARRRHRVTGGVRSAEIRPDRALLAAS